MESLVSAAGSRLLMIADNSQLNRPSRTSQPLRTLSLESPTRNCLPASSLDGHTQSPVPSSTTFHLIGPISCAAVAIEGEGRPVFQIREDGIGDANIGGGGTMGPVLSIL